MSSGTATSGGGCGALDNSSTNTPPPSAVLVLEYTQPVSEGTSNPANRITFEPEDISQAIRYLTGGVFVQPASVQIISVNQSSPALRNFDSNRFCPVLALLPSTLKEDAIRKLQQSLPSLTFPRAPGAPNLRMIVTPWSRGHWEQIIAATVCFNTGSSPPSGASSAVHYGGGPAPSSGGALGVGGAAGRVGGVVASGSGPMGHQSHHQQPRASSVGPYSPVGGLPPPVGVPGHTGTGPGGVSSISSPKPPPPPSQQQQQQQQPQHGSMVRFELINMFFLENKGFDVVEAIVGKGASHVQYILNKAQGQVDLRMKGYASDSAPTCDRLHLELKGRTPEMTYGAADHVSDLLNSVRQQLMQFASERSVTAPSNVGFREHRYVAQYDTNTSGGGSWAGSTGEVTWKYIH